MTNQLRMKLMGPVIVATVWRPGPTFAWWVLHHLALGFAKVIVFFDDPEDPAIEVAEKIQDVIFFRCDDEYWTRRANAQSVRADPTRMLAFEARDRVGPPEAFDVMSKQLVNVDFALSIAHQLGSAWLLHLDDDEVFYSPNETVVEHFAGLPDTVGQVTYLNMEALPERCDVANCFEEVTLFKVNPVALNDDALAELHEGKAGEYWRERNGFFLAYVNGKSAVRVRPGIRPLGVHLFNEPDGLESLMVSDPLILHYLNHCDYGAWLAKYRRRGNFSNTWLGKDIPITFHLASRDVVHRGNLEAAREFYASRVVMSDEQEIQRQLQSGVVVRVVHEPATP